MRMFIKTSDKRLAKLNTELIHPLEQSIAFDDLRMIVPQAGYCSAARSVRVLTPLTVKDVRTLPTYRDWKLGPGVPVKHVR